MSGMTFLVVTIIALAAGYIFNWLSPRVQPMLPSAVTSNVFFQSIATGVFILVVIAIAHFVAKAAFGKKARKAISIAS